MYECVILYRVNNGPVEFVGDPDDEGMMAIFPNIDVAIAYCDDNQLFRSGQANHQIVELDEL